jgi:hypothetical protein
LAIRLEKNIFEADRRELGEYFLSRLEKYLSGAETMPLSAGGVIWSVINFIARKTGILSTPSMTQPLFLAGIYLFGSPAKIINRGLGDNGPYLIFDKTIVYPQGGGQPSDVGTIKCEETMLEITRVKKDENEMRHYLNGEYPDDLVGTDCLCALDKQIRILHARFHSAGHLLSNIVEDIWPELVAIKAHCFPDAACQHPMRSSTIARCPTSTTLL